MKKKRNISPVFPKNRWWKICMIMRLTLLISICFVLTTSGKGLAQKRVNMNLGETTVKKALAEFQRQTGRIIVYSDDNFLTTGRVTADFKDAPLEKFLKSVLKGSKMTYKLKDDFILIVPEETVITPLPAISSEIIRIKGIVKDKQGSALPGVTVLIKGTSIGVATDIDGKFELSLPADTPPVFIFSFIGMKDVEVKYSGQKELVVVLEDDIEEMDEVVVTGYGNVKKSSFTGASTTVKKEDLLKVSQGNIINALQVFDPSLRMIKNNQMGADPNTMPEFYVRGRSGMDGVKQLDQAQAAASDNVSKFALTNNPNTPIFIMDGYEVSVEKVYDYDPNRIESITILKDAAATAIYGSRASNGVIVIETIAPTPGRLNVSYNFTGTITAADLSDYNLMNAREKLNAELVYNSYDETYLTDKYRIRDYLNKRNNVLNGIDTYWLSQPLQVEFNHKHGVYIEGGTNDIRFGAELRYDKQNGIMKESFRNRMGAGLYIDYRFKNLQVRNHITYDIVKSEDSPYGNFQEYTQKQPYESPRDENGKYVQTLPDWEERSDADRINPLYEASLGNHSRSGYNELVNNLSINYYITPQIQFKGQFSITLNNSDTDNFTDPLSGAYVKAETLFDKGDLKLSETERFSWNTNLLLMYNNSINKHHMNFTLGVNATENETSYMYSHYRGFASAALNSIGNAKEIVTKPIASDNHTRLFGTFLSLNYTYNNIYLLDLSARLDGSSEFGSDNKFAIFGSMGAGINIHNYEFMKNTPFINLLKIKATYGQTGRVNYPPYAARNTFETMLDDWYTTGIGTSLNYMGNQDLTWEKTNTLNIGADVSIWDGRVTLGLTWYNKQTVDLITDVTIPSSSGFTSYKDNMGEVRNRGVEADLNLQIVRSKNWNSFLFARLAHNKNEILKISKSLEAYNEQIDRHFSKYQSTKSEFSTPFMKYEEGGSMTSVFGMKSLGINPANGKEVFVNRDGTTTYTWDSSQQQILGDTEPLAQGSLGLNLQYKNFTLYTSFLFEFGGQEYNQTLVDKVENANVLLYNVDKRVMSERWQKAGNVTRLKALQDRFEVTRPTSRFVQDKNNIQFNSLSFSYDFEKDLLKKIRMSTLKLQFGMNEIATFSTIRQERGLSYPFARSFNFTLNASF